ncbi:MAG: hypothetical protein EA373_00330 [Oceanospirillales bacterium]|nr:MAG: hypothetical protein EA373_00330 [Oceanospirillales bacterium]
MSKLKQSSLSMIIRNTVDNSYHAVQLGMWGALGGAVGSILSEVIRTSDDRQITLAMLAISTGFWFSIIGYSIAFSLLLGNGWYLKNELKSQESFQLAVFSGAIPGLIAGTVYLNGFIRVS